jgi:hypothetical protein
MRGWVSGLIASWSISYYLSKMSGARRHIFKLSYTLLPGINV